MSILVLLLLGCFEPSADTHRDATATVDTAEPPEASAAERARRN